MVVASPWSRGGWVCSQVFDHTSVLQLLEQLLTHRTGKKIEETNISRWRRTVCGDLSSVFRAARAETVTSPAFPKRDAFIREIHRARFMKLPAAYRSLTPEEVQQARSTPSSPLLPEQEKGVRRSCALPYQLYAEGALDTERRKFTLRLEARSEVFGNRTAGTPFNVFAFGGPEGVTTRAYAVAAGDRLEDTWNLEAFTGGAYHLQVHGPNGWMREFKGAGNDPAVEFQVEYTHTRRNGPALTGEVEVRLVNRDSRPHEVTLRDHGYGNKPVKRTLRPGATATIRLNTSRSHGWYDFSLTLAGANAFEKRYAGRVETGKASYSDPVMGRTA
jgi:phospholipase C